MVVEMDIFKDFLKSNIFLWLNGTWKKARILNLQAQRLKAILVKWSLINMALDMLSLKKAAGRIPNGDPAKQQLRHTNQNPKETKQETERE